MATKNQRKTTYLFCKVVPRHSINPHHAVWKINQWHGSFKQWANATYIRIYKINRILRHPPAGRQNQEKKAKAEVEAKVKAKAEVKIEDGIVLHIVTLTI
jgi:hypothetical protein